MTQLVIHSTLLRRQQQQQKTQCFEHVSHSAQRFRESSRNPQRYQNQQRFAAFVA
jgi:hypothetical protein